MNTVKIDSASFQVPSAWDELTRKQFLFVSNLFNRKLSVIEFKVKILLHCLAIKPILINRIEPEDVYFLCQSFDFLTKDISLTRNLIPAIWKHFIKYHGPSDKMLHCSFGEFTRAHNRMDQYIKTKDEKVLNEIIAILYRPKKAFWFIRKHLSNTKDPRRKLHDISLKKRTVIFSKIDPNIKYGIFLFFTGVLNSLPIQFPNVFRKKEDQEEDNKFGWVPLVISLADGKTDDESLERVLNSNLYNVFFGLEQKAIEYFKYLQETKRHE